MRAAVVIIGSLVLAGTAEAQEIIDLQRPGTGHPLEGTSSPSVDNGVANGIVKAPGAPSVDAGRANGIVKAPGAPSVGDGVANGVVKSTTVNQ
jgi:hypothetical protein